jgi:hypothetical protein
VSCIVTSLRVFENKVLKRIFGPKRDEIIGGWIKLQNEGLQNFYFSSKLNYSEQEDEMGRVCNI